MTNYMGDRDDLQSVRSDMPRDEELAPDFAHQNDLLGFAEEVINYVLNELMNNGGDWKDQFDSMDDNDKQFFFRAIADGFNDSVDN